MGIHGYSYSSNLQMLLDSHRITLNQYNIVYEYLLSRRVCVYLAYNCNLYNSLSRVVSEKGSQEKIGMGFLKKKKQNFKNRNNFYVRHKGNKHCIIPPSTSSNFTPSVLFFWFDFSFIPYSQNNDVIIDAHTTKSHLSLLFFAG